MDFFNEKYFNECTTQSQKRPKIWLEGYSAFVLLHQSGEGIKNTLYTGHGLSRFVYFNNVHFRHQRYQ